MVAIMPERSYTVRLGAGLGLIDETAVLLDLWHDGTDTSELTRLARESGQFPGLSASRLENLVSDGFAPRYLVPEGPPAHLLKLIQPAVTRREFEQLLFLYTCRAHPILADFVREVYWPAYAAGRQSLSNVEARRFVTVANQHGKTMTPWTEQTIRRAAGYLTGCCSDFGLLEPGRRVERRILPYRIEPRVAAFLAHERHFAGSGDNRLLSDPDWALFGLEPDDVLALLKHMALQGILIVQSAAGIIHLGWTYKSLDEVLHAIAQGNL